MDERGFLRRVFTPEAILVELVFLGLFAGTPPVVRTLLDMTFPMALMVGLGAGLLGAAALFGLYLLPRRERIREHVRVTLRDFAQEGDKVIYVGGDKSRWWKMKVADFLADAIGPDAVGTFIASDLPSEQLRELRVLTDSLPSLKIRQGFTPSR
jgi:hypothetical protein